MKASIIKGSVFHSRKQPRVHNFSYPIALACLDLTKMININTSLIKLDRLGLVYIDTQEYLATGNTLYDKYKNFITDRAHSIPTGSVFLLTMPRVFGYVFNPVSFYFGFNHNNTIHSVIAEVSNTFGERQAYLLSSLNDTQQQLPISYKFPKEFYVSPFLDAGNYCLTFESFEPNLKINISLEQHSQKVFFAELCGKHQKLSTINLATSFFSMLISSCMAMLRIHLQAFILYIIKGVSIYKWQASPHPNLLVSQQKFIHRLRLKILGILNPREEK